MKLLILAVCLLFSSPSMAGQYRLSYQWPSGIYTSMTWMADKDEKLCRAVEADLAKLGPLTAPLGCDMSIGHSTFLSKVNWTTVQKDKSFSLAQKLEILQREESSDEIKAEAKTENFVQLLKSRIESGEIKISLGMVPGPSGSEIQIARYQRWDCQSKTTDKDRFARVRFFHIKSNDFSEVAQIIRLPLPSNAFIFQGKTYFYDDSFRHLDNNWKELPEMQSEIYVYGFYSEDMKFLNTLCRLLYWQDWKKLP